MRFSPITTITLCLLLASFISCDPDVTNEPVDFFTLANRDIIVTNEGQFNNMNASLSYINTSTDTLDNDVFANINDQPLADLIQSAVQMDSELWLVTNNPGSIIILDIKTLEFKEQILIDGSPKNIAKTEDNLVFISDVFSGIHVLDRSASEVVFKIETGGGVYEMIDLGTQVVACNVGSYSAPESLLTVYNKESYSVAKTISVGESPTSIIQSGDYLYAVSQGTNDEGVSVAKILKEDLSLAENFSLKDKVNLSYNHKLRAYNGSVFVIGDGLYSLDINNGETVKLFDSATYLYSMDINPANGDIYICDAKDFASQGTVFVLDQSGVESISYNVGFVPNGVVVIE